MLHRRILSIVALCFLATTVRGANPNIVLLMGDDHGWEETGYNGHPYVQTPVLDAMAKSGLRMNRFYAGHPSCSPTRGSVMTGRHPVRYGTYAPNWSIRPEERTIGHLLSGAGYRCGHFGKWHLGPVKKSSPTSPGAMGFHHWVSHDNFFEIDPWLSRDGEPPEQFRGEGSEVVVDLAIDFIRHTKLDGKPFLTVIWFGSPHEPYSGLPEDLALYDDLPQRYAQRKVKLTSNETGRPVERPLRDVLRERYAEITAMDRAIGKLRDFLEAEGMRDNTLLWYCGDNGTPSSGVAESPLRGQKATMYEGGIRVPGLIEWPARISSPRSTDVPSVTSDILPTLCAITGTPLVDRPLDGIDVSGLFDGSLAARSKPIGFWSFPTRVIADRDTEPYIPPPLQQGTTPLVKLMNGKPTRTFRNFHHREIREEDFGGQRVLMDGDFKLILDGNPDDSKRQLFHLGNDPAETTNLANKRPKVVARMTKQLRTWQQSVLNSLTGKDYE